MSTRQIKAFFCDSATCGRSQIPPGKGWRLAGNISAVDGGGFLGNNLAKLKNRPRTGVEIVPDHGIPEDQQVVAEKVVLREQHFCNACFFDALQEAAGYMDVSWPPLP